ncbi:hypothetical protein [Aureispira anguillae]|nr:hypothetical protein [Aureispira anguillae]
MNEELPKFNSLDEGIDFLMGYLHRFSEDLWEHDFYINKRWMEVRDDINFQEAILHVFEDNGQYLRILDGDISTGSWEYTLGGLVIKFAGRHELYERVFLNESFFILKKHGDHSSKGNRSKYFFIATESLARRMEWTDLLVVMYEIYKSNTNYMAIVVGFFLLVALIIILSII